MELTEFEVWIYATSEQETTLSTDDYLAVISLNYSSPWALHELRKLLTSYINWGDARRWELQEVLQAIVHGSEPDTFLAAIISTFTLLCAGYKFLSEIAHHGVNADNDFGWDPEKKWGKMTERQKQHYLAQFYPDVQIQAICLFSELASGAIMIHQSAPEEEVTFTDNRNPMDHQAASFTSDVQRAEQWWKLWR